VVNSCQFFGAGWQQCSVWDKRPQEAKVSRHDAILSQTSRRIDQNRDAAASESDEAAVPQAGEEKRH
jgi:hypothetical protein